MKKNTVLTRILAISGTVLVVFPILAPVLFSGFRFASGRIFNFDYLMPAELFPIALIGSGLLLWASIRARSHRVWIAGGLVAAVVLLFGGQGLAVITGLASGETEPSGWPMTLVLSALGLYALALLVIAVGGVLLLRDLFIRGIISTNPNRPAP